MNRNTFLLVFSALIIGIGFNSFYIVNEKQNAIVLQFGEAVRADIPVGFHFKLPIIQEVKNMMQGFKHLMRNQIES
jgi:membrane protease subunit HflC